MTLPASARVLTVLAVLAAAPAARASPFCDAVTKAAGGAAFGFVTVRGALVPEAHTSSFDVYRARVALPGATDCNVTVPHGAGLGGPAYACAFSGGVDVRRAMGRLVRRTARCVQVGVGNPPRLKQGPAGPSFYFASGPARFDFSAEPPKTRLGLWTVTLGVSKGPNQPRRPVA